MKKSELTSKFLAGTPILVVEYRSGAAENIMCRDKADPNGKRVARPIIKHNVEMGGKPVSVTEWVDDRNFDVANFKSPYTRGKTYALMLTDMASNKGHLEARGAMVPIEE